MLPHFQTRLPVRSLLNTIQSANAFSDRLRSFEQTFGGITANLWDDPFEWTLPEHLSSPAKVQEHLLEVEALRQRAFSSFDDDQCLLKHIAMPSGNTQTLIALLLETLLRATSLPGTSADHGEDLSGNSAAGFITRPRQHLLGRQSQQTRGLLECIVHNADSSRFPT